MSTGYDFVPSCRQNGASVPGAGGQPTSNVWLRIGTGAQWFPLAWTQLSDLGAVRPC